MMSWLGQPCMIQTKAQGATTYGSDPLTRKVPLDIGTKGGTASRDVESAPIDTTGRIVSVPRSVFEAEPPLADPPIGSQPEGKGVARPPPAFFLMVVVLSSIRLFKLFIFISRAPNRFSNAAKVELLHWRAKK